MALFGAGANRGKQVEVEMDQGVRGETLTVNLRCPLFFACLHVDSTAYPMPFARKMR